MACLIDVKHHNFFTTDAKRGTLKTIGIDSCDLLASRPATVTGALRNCSLHNLESLINQNPFGMCGPLAGRPQWYWFDGGKVRKSNRVAVPDAATLPPSSLTSPKWWRGPGSNPQALGATRYGRIIYRLDVDLMVFQQYIACSFAELGIADHHWHDVSSQLAL